MLCKFSMLFSYEAEDEFSGQDYLTGTWLEQLLFALNLLQLDCGLRRNDVAESHFVGSILFDPTYA